MIRSRNEYSDFTEEYIPKSLVILEVDDSLRIRYNKTMNYGAVSHVHFDFHQPDGVHRRVRFRYHDRIIHARSEYENKFYLADDLSGLLSTCVGDMYNTNTEYKREAAQDGVVDSVINSYITQANALEERVKYRIYNSISNYKEGQIYEANVIYDIGPAIKEIKRVVTNEDLAIMCSKDEKLVDMVKSIKYSEATEYIAAMLLEKLK